MNVFKQNIRSNSNAFKRSIYKWTWPICQYICEFDVHEPWNAFIFGFVKIIYARANKSNSSNTATGIEFAVESVESVKIRMEFLNRVKRLAKELNWRSTVSSIFKRNHAENSTYYNIYQTINHILLIYQSREKWYQLDTQLSLYIQLCYFIAFPFR